MANTEVASGFVSIYPQLAHGFRRDLNNQLNDAGDGIDEFSGRMSRAAGIGSFFGNILGTVVTGALSAVSSSIGAAVARVDTLNNFPKVMSSLGYEADVADAAIHRMSEHLTGLPTALDGMVSHVQILTAAMGDLDKATDVGLALNDMILAGNASTQEAASAMNQFSQMIAAGKVDAQAWQSVVNAAPGQLTQLSQALIGAGANQKDLYEALKSGTISMDEFMDKIVEMDMEGGDGFESFAKQAIAATGGIQTAMDNMRIAVSRSVANVLDVIGQANIAAIFNNASTIISGVGNVVRDFVQGIANSKVGEFFSGIIKNATNMADAFKLLTGTLHDNGTIIDAVSSKINAFIEFFRPAYEAFHKAVEDIILPAWHDLKQEFADFVANDEAFNQDTGFMASMQDFGEWLRDSGLPDLIRYAVGQFKTMMVVMVKIGEVIVWIIGRAKSLYANISSVATGIGVAIGTAIRYAIEIFNAFRDAVAYVGEVLGSIPGIVEEKWNAFTAFFSGIPAALSARFEEAQGYIREKLSGIVEFARSIPEQIIGFFAGLGQKLVDAIGSIHFPKPHVEWGSLVSPDGKFNVGNILPTITFAANGGIVDKLVMGEAGPEAIIPLSANKLQPIAQSISAQMDGGNDEILWWLNHKLGSVIAESAPSATPRDFGRAVRAYG